jgi:hypothetical protein
MTVREVRRKKQTSNLRLMNFVRWASLMHVKEIVAAVGKGKGKTAVCRVYARTVRQVGASWGGRASLETGAAPSMTPPVRTVVLPPS